MKVRNILAVIAFLSAIGSAIASSIWSPVPAYSRKIDVPGQVEDCVQRGLCEGTGAVCKIFFDHDNNPLTPEISRDMYSASTGQCGVALQRSN